MFLVIKRGKGAHVDIGQAEARKYETGDMTTLQWSGSLSVSNSSSRG